MKADFYTDGLGNHKVTLHCENEIEKTLMHTMSMYKMQITAGFVGEKATMQDEFQITFTEKDRLS